MKGAHGHVTCAKSLSEAAKEFPERNLAAGRGPPSPGASDPLGVALRIDKADIPRAGQAAGAIRAGATEGGAELDLHGADSGLFRQLERW